MWPKYNSDVKKVKINNFYFKATRYFIANKLCFTF